MKRFFVDWWGNYAFFVPLVGALNGVLPAMWGGATWSWDVFLSYAVISVPTAALGGRLFTVFLERFWYPLCREKFYAD